VKDAAFRRKVRIIKPKRKKWSTEISVEIGGKETKIHDETLKNQLI